MESKKLNVYNHKTMKWEIWEGEILDYIDLSGVKEGYYHMDGSLELVGEMTHHLYNNVFGSFVKVY